MKEIKDKVRRLKKEGLTRKQIGEQLGLSLGQVDRFLYTRADEPLYFVSAKLVFQHIDRSFPEESNASLARMIGKDEKRVYSYRTQETMTLNVADELLTKLDMNYLFATGDIPVYNSRLEVEH